ncbi:MAG TPA: hypothetical protein VIW29_15790 [Polyangiaceae bacterium]
MEPLRDAVKTPKGRENIAAAGRGFARHFAGWELYAITVVVVAVSGLLSLPRRAAPDLFPVPLIDVAEEAATLGHYAALADRAEREGLPFETRAVGDALRRLGRTGVANASDVEHVRRVLDERVRAALGAGQLEALVRLRAVQVRLFLRALRAHDWRGEPSNELRELGGEFPERALKNGWAGPEGCVASEAELSALYALRWGELTHLREHPAFKSTLAEWRRYYRFLLLYPEQAPGVEGARAERAELRLRYVEALARRDRDYPAALARGSLLAELGEGTLAAAELRAFLGRPGGGEWTLRARNYLVHLSPAASPADEP